MAMFDDVAEDAGLMGAVILFALENVDAFLEWVNREDEAHDRRTSMPDDPDIVRNELTRLANDMFKIIQIADNMGGRNRGRSSRSGTQLSLPFPQD